ncbi:unnamed protein product, partial [Polarella glacialis]
PAAEAIAAGASARVTQFAAGEARSLLWGLSRETPAAVADKETLLEAESSWPPQVIGSADLSTAWTVFEGFEASKSRSLGPLGGPYWQALLAESEQRGRLGGELRLLRVLRQATISSTSSLQVINATAARLAQEGRAGRARQLLLAAAAARGLGDANSERILAALGQTSRASLRRDRWASFDGIAADVALRHAASCLYAHTPGVWRWKQKAFGLRFCAEAYPSPGKGSEHGRSSELQILGMVLGARRQRLERYLRVLGTLEDSFPRLGGGDGVPTDGSVVALGLGKVVATSSVATALGPRAQSDQISWMSAELREQALEASMGRERFTKA